MIVLSGVLATGVDFELVPAVSLLCPMNLKTTKMIIKTTTIPMMAGATNLKGEPAIGGAAIGLGA